MMVTQADRPLGARPDAGRGAHRPVGLHGAAAGVPAEHVGAGVGRVGQHAQHPGVVEPAPPQLPGPRPAVGAQREPPALEGADHAVGRAGGPERGEHVSHRGLDLLVRVDDHVAVGVVDVADRQRHPQVPAFGRGPFRPLQPAGQQVQLGLAHRALQPQQQPVVEVGQVVDPVAVDQQRVGEPGQLQQPGQVRRRAGQPGNLQPEDRPDLAEADPADHLAEAAAVLGGPAGQAQVGVDDHHVAVGPAQPHRLVGQRVLPGGRLGVLPHLRQRRLPHVDDRRPVQMRAADLRLGRPRAGHGRPPAPPRPCWPPPTPPRPPTRPGPASLSPARGGPATRC